MENKDYSNPIFDITCLNTNFFVIAEEDARRDFFTALGLGYNAAEAPVEKDCEPETEESNNNDPEPEPEQRIIPPRVGGRKQPTKYGKGKRGFTPDASPATEPPKKKRARKAKGSAGQRTSGKLACSGKKLPENFFNDSTINEWGEYEPAATPSLPAAEF